ncbi:MAG: zinc ABC transporter substrate-binding protein [Candidatus Rokubacteria bacterium]|nr:zinc ABC transporter substrate-binding protein [Candidatus Rokubacteria bacterium]
MSRAAGALGIAAFVLAGALPALWLWPGRPPGTERLVVVATFYPLHEFARQVGGDRVEVTTLVPAGVEPHDWEPSPQDVARLERARVFIYNGAGLEPWVGKLLEAARASSRVIVNTTERVPLRTADLPGHDDDKHRLESQGQRGWQAPDPHVWLDPLLAQIQVEAIRAGLAEAAPASAATFEASARAVAGELSGLHRELERGLADCARREVVTSHAAFGYLAARYRLTVVPIMGLAPEAEPSPAELARIVRFARRRQVRAVFSETLVSPKLAETLSREIGARTLVLNPIEGLTKEDAAAGKNYLSLMRDNLQSLRAGLECR